MSAWSGIEEQRQILKKIIPLDASFSNRHFSLTEMTGYRFPTGKNKSYEEKHSKLKRSPGNLSGTESNQSCVLNISSRRRKPPFCPANLSSEHLRQFFRA